MAAAACGASGHLPGLCGGNSSTSPCSPHQLGWLSPPGPTLNSYGAKMPLGKARSG